MPGGGLSGYWFYKLDLTEVGIHGAVVLALLGTGIGAGLCASLCTGLLALCLGGLLVDLLADGVESLLQVILLGLDVVHAAGLQGFLQGRQLGLDLALLLGGNLVAELAQRLLGLEHHLVGVVAPIAHITRLMRSSMLEVSRQDYVRTARSKGVPEGKVIGKHMVRNAILPVVTYLGPLVAALTTGSFAIERLFMIPGIGRYFVNAVGDRDYTVIMGLTIFYGAFIMLCTLLVDIAYAIIDPRVKLDQ